MKKMKLELDELTVESFETAAADDETGTVLAHAVTRPIQETCNGPNTCYDSCPSSSLLTQPEPTCPSNPSDNPVICQSYPYYCPSYPEICG